jgi:hypothetical protein
MAESEINGLGGSYLIGEDGEVSLVERTAQFEAIVEPEAEKPATKKKIKEQ